MLIQKVAPLAAWTMKDVWTYLKANGIPPMPLYDRGYTSIGCEPCTVLPSLEAGDRSGRWGGKKVGVRNPYPGFVLTWLPEARCSSQPTSKAALCRGCGRP
jgi:hypothetical protein